MRQVLEQRPQSFLKGQIVSIYGFVAIRPLCSGKTLFTEAAGGPHLGHFPKVLRIHDKVYTKKKNVRKVLKRIMKED